MTSMTALVHATAWNFVLALPICCFLCCLSGSILLHFCVVRGGSIAADNDTPPDREKSLELIRYLVPEVFNGALMDSLSGHALNAAGVAVSFLLEGEEQAKLPAPPLSICSVIKAQKPGL